MGFCPRHKVVFTIRVLVVLDVLVVSVVVVVLAMSVMIVRHNDECHDRGSNVWDKCFPYDGLLISGTTHHLWRVTLPFLLHLVVPLPP